MPEEDKAVEGSEVATSAVVVAASGHSRIASFINDPLNLLIKSVPLFALLGVLFIISDILAFEGPVRSQFIGVLNDSFGVLAGISLILGLIRIVKAIRRRKAGTPFEMPTVMGARLKSPEFLFIFGPFIVVTIKLAQLVLIFWDAGGASDWAIWNEVFSKLFTGTAALMFILTLKAVADSIERCTRVTSELSERPMKANEAPASGPETSPASVAASVAGPAQSGESAMSDAVAEDTGAKVPAGPSFNERLEALVNDPAGLLKIGIFALAYFGLLELIFQILLWRDFLSSGALWRVIFEQVAVTGGAVGLLMTARIIVSWLARQSVASGPMGRQEAESVGAWLDRVLNQPKQALDIALALTFVAGAAFFLIDLWSERNDDASDFWAQTLENMLYGLIGMGTLLLLRALVPMLVDGMVGLRQRAPVAADGPMLNDPARLLRFFTFALVYFGLGWVATTQVAVREWADGWEIWYMFLLPLLISGLVAGVSLAFQAMYAELLASPAED